MVGRALSDCFTHGGSPGGLMFEHGIQNGNELAHASGERHLRCFPGCTEALVESLEIRIKTYSDESAHVEHCTYLPASAPDPARASRAAAIAVERRNPGQGRDLLAIECSQLGQISEQGSTGSLADPWHRAQEILLLSPHRRGSDHAAELAIDDDGVLF